MIPVLVFLVISGLIGGGASVAAESSLPGDLLYSVKVGVNERVGEFLAASTEAKADFDAKIAVRRIQEAESLSIRGKVDADTAARLESNFKAYADRVATRVADLNADGKLDVALEANSNFQSSLSAHQDVLARLAAKDNDNSDKSALLNLSAKVVSEVNSLALIQLNIESKIKADGVQSAAEGKLKAAQNKVEESAKFIADNKASVSADVAAKAEAQLNVANSFIAQGKIKLEARAYGEAFVLFQKALRAAQQAKEMVSANANIDLEIKTILNINLENQNERESSSGQTSDRNGATVQVDGNAGAESNDSGANATGEVKVKVGL